MASYRVRATFHITATVEYMIEDREAEPVADPKDEALWTLAEEEGQPIAETVEVIIGDSRGRLVNIERVACSVISME
jgi:hypothetical protein